MVRVWCLLVVMVWAALSPVQAADPPARSRVALVIGNADYRAGKLRNAVADAQAMADDLRGRGYQVMLGTNLTKARMQAIIEQFGHTLQEGGEAIVYYSGHGLQLSGENYLVPIDASITSERSVRLEAVSLQAVLDQIYWARTQLNLVILDACRNNPFASSFRSAATGLAQTLAPEGTLIAYATAPGRVASDGEGANGLYTAALLRAMAVPNQSIENVFKAARQEVARASGGNQIPWESSSLIGDFILPPVQRASIAVPSPPPTAPASGGASRVVVPPAALPAPTTTILDLVSDPSRYVGKSTELRADAYFAGQVYFLGSGNAEIQVLIDMPDVRRFLISECTINDERQAIPCEARVTLVLQGSGHWATVRRIAVVSRINGRQVSGEATAPPPAPPPTQPARSQRN